MEETTSSLPAAQAKFDLFAFERHLDTIEGLTLAQAAVLRALIFLVNGRTGKSSDGHPITLARLAEKSRASIRTVCRCLIALEAKGLVTRERHKARHISGSWFCLPTSYEFTMPANDVSPRSSERMTSPAVESVVHIPDFDLPDFGATLEPLPWYGAPSPRTTVAASTARPAIFAHPVAPKPQDAPAKAQHAPMAKARSWKDDFYESPGVASTSGPARDITIDIIEWLERQQPDWHLDAHEVKRWRFAVAALKRGEGDVAQAIDDTYYLWMPIESEDVLERIVREWIVKVVLDAEERCRTGAMMARALNTFMRAKSSVLRYPEWMGVAS